MSGYPKYKKPNPIPLKERKWPSNTIEREPVWCSVDLRDGNQALPVPMSPEKKLNYFNLLLKIGFKEIEAGFPSASQDDYDFIRNIIEGNLAPEGVKISVLTQARPHLIERTVESLAGVKKAIVHCYVACSDLHAGIVFGKSREDMKKMAVEGTALIRRKLKEAGLLDRVSYEFSPEEFTDSDPDYIIDVCKAVCEAWDNPGGEKVILNLPATVERRPPYQYADMIEYFIDNFPYRKDCLISLHAHNDQGCAIAATEMALLAGADRVEGTIFGHGERTGNLDTLIFALNLKSRGVKISLDFSDMNGIVKTVEQASGIDVHPRHPYAGELAFTAFSGSHQDAIRKGLDSRAEASKMFKQGWKIPYLHLDPSDVGRQYEKLIRINSQSGKGGVVYVLEHEFGIYPPKPMHPEIGSEIQRHADEKGGEINSKELLDIFEKKFVNVREPLSLRKFYIVHPEKSGPDTVTVKILMDTGKGPVEVKGTGNGPISAAVHALRTVPGVPEFKLEDFREQTLGVDADATALAYVGVRRISDNILVYGAGEHTNIDQAAIMALFSALNRAVLNK